MRAGALRDDPRISETTERAISAARPLLRRHPGALSDLVEALALHQGAQVVITGERPDLLAEVRRRWLPGATLVWGERDDGPLFAGRPDDPAQAYLCRGRVCDRPTAEVANLAAQLNGLEQSSFARGRS